MFPLSKRGFTLIEMMIIIAIIGIIFAIVWPRLGSCGETQKFMPQKNSSAAWEGTLIQLKENPNLDLVVFAYADVWTYEDKEGAGRVDEAIDSVNSVIDSFVRVGIARSRLIFGMANKGGMTMEEELHIDGNGIYLQLK